MHFHNIPQCTKERKKKKYSYVITWPSSGIRSEYSSSSLKSSSSSLFSIFFYSYLFTFFAVIVHTASYGLFLITSLIFIYLFFLFFVVEQQKRQKLSINHIHIIFCVWPRDLFSSSVPFFSLSFTVFTAFKV